MDANETSGIAAIIGRSALYLHLMSIQSSNKPMKPPNRMQTAKVKGGETPAEASMTSKKYIRNRYAALNNT